MHTMIERLREKWPRTIRHRLNLITHRSGKIRVFLMRADAR